MSLDHFEEWLERTHPEHTDLMEEYTQYTNAEYKKSQKLWNEYLEEWGREEECPVCHYPILYVQPQPENFPVGAELFTPCLNGCGGLIVTNIKGVPTSEFIVPLPSQPRRGKKNERLPSS